MTMPLKLEPFKEFIISEYKSGKNCQKIADENGWYQQPVSNLLKHYKLYDSYRPDNGNTKYFETVDTHLKAYFLGFITADGCLQRSTAKSKTIGLSITIHEKDICILNKLKEELGCENKISFIRTGMTHNKEQMKQHCRFSIHNSELTDSLLKIGLTERKSTTMPNIHQNIPEEFRKSFVLGYFDGDGSVSLNKKRGQLMVSFRGTEAFLQGIVDVLQLQAHWLSKDKQKDCWSLVFWRKSDLLSFLQIYENNNLYLSRKYVKFLDFFKIDKDQTISSS